MTLLAAREFAGRGIRVNTIVAGSFDPPILDVTGREAAAGQIQFFANSRKRSLRCLCAIDTADHKGTR
jgi:3-hydroxyacyl-CoA dehydrogenase / 3-hydroxy-2-methylbutyryl-CoA dehydrogenase